MNIRRIMTCDKVCGGYQIRRANRIFAETQMRLCQTAGLLGVIYKVCLTVQVCRMTDNLDGVFVCAYRTVRAHAPEYGGGQAFCGQLRFFCARQRCVGDIIDDANGEIVLRLVLLEVLKDGNNLTRCGVLGGQTVTAADNRNIAADFLEDGANVLIQRLAHGARLLGAVENSDFLDGLRQNLEEMLRRERTVQVNVYHTDFFALAHQEINRFGGGLCAGTHQDDDAFCILCTVVVKQLVRTAGNLADLVHVMLYRVRNGGNLGVTCFTALEEDVRIYGGAAGCRMLRIQRVLAECLEGIHVDQRAQIFVVQRFNLLNLVRRAEAVEEVQERHALVNGSQMSNGAQIHNFLRGGRSQHSKAGVADCHDVGMVTEDRQCMRRQRAGGDMEHARKHFACDFVHVRNHEQQTLRCRVRGGQSAGLERAVHGTGCAAFRLHFHNVYRLAEQIFFAVCCPLIHVFSHRGGRCDRVNARNLGKCVRNVRSSLVAVHDFDFLRHTIHLLKSNRIQY